MCLHAAKTGAKMKDKHERNQRSGGNMHSASLDINIGAAIKTTDSVSRKVSLLTLKNSYFFRILSKVVLFFFDKKVRKCEQRLVTLCLDLRLIRCEAANSLDAEFNEHLIEALDRLKSTLTYSLDRLVQLSSFLSDERYVSFMNLLKETYSMADRVQIELEEQNATVSLRSREYVASSVKELEAVLDKIASLDE